MPPGEIRLRLGNGATFNFRTTSLVSGPLPGGDLDGGGAARSPAGPSAPEANTYVLRDRRPAGDPRPRAARGEPVSRPLAAIGLAARVRRAGDRPGACCRPA